MKVNRPAAIAAALLVSSVASAATSHTFRLDTSSWQTQPKTLTVAGSFNGWNKTATPMKAVDKIWQATVPLPDGVTTYKFLADGERWLPDPAADKSIEADDGNGGKNSGVDPKAAKKPAAGKVAVVAGHAFTLDTSSWEKQPKTLAVAGSFNDWNATATPMKKVGPTKWQAVVQLPDGVSTYKFVADGERWLPDPTADKSLDADDGLGGKNSGVRSGSASPAGDAKPDGPAAETAAVSAGHVFALDTSAWDTQPKSVTVAGSFNGWNKDAAPMVKRGTVWTVAVPLADGVHQYKFVVDGERYIPDPKGDKAFDADDTFGGTNSGVLIGPDARKLPPAAENAIAAEGLRFDANDQADLNIVSDTQVRFRIRTQAGDVRHVFVTYAAAGGDTAWKKAELNKIGTLLGYDSYGGTVAFDPAMAGKDVKFYFDLRDGNADLRYANGKANTNDDVAVSDAQTVTLKPTFTTPAWAETAIWYQIFPERFANGDTSNDPGGELNQVLIKWTSKWYDAQPGEAPGAANYYEGKGNVWNRRYGGDIQGLRQKLPYLKDLGITAIYLNPVFEAESMHKYDTADFRHVDQHFGVKGSWPVAGETEDPATWKWSQSDKVFLDFIADAHANGMKVVIDGVFNHVGRRHPFFMDVLAKGKNSPYADWFEITDWGNEANWKPMADPYTVHGKAGGVQWRAWDGLNGHLPAFKKSGETGLARKPYDHIMAITKRWLAPDGDPTKGIDGWRLDAANEIPHPFWRDWRRVVKETKPDAYITGEIWSPAQPWINDGKQFDAVMNYQFAMPAQAFFVNRQKAMKPSEFLSKLVDVTYLYPQQASRVMMNLFDSHDTDRLASMFVNPDLNYDGANRLQDNGPKYATRKPTGVERARMMQAVACQMTYLGAPMLYYGTEAGMWSADDPSNRQPMTWPGVKFDDPQVGFDSQIFAAFKKLIAVRQSLPALQRGDFFPVTANDAEGTLVYGRRLGRQTVYVALNRSETPRTVKFDVPAEQAGRGWTNRMTGKTVANLAGGIELAPYGWAILSAE